jgi:cell division protein FtsB
MIPLLRSKIFLVGVVVAIVLVGMGVGRVVLRNRALAQEVAALEAESQRLAARNTEFTELMKRFETQAFLEHEARVKLNLQKPGERVIAFRSGGSTSSTEPIAEKKNTTNVDLWWNYFFPTTIEGGGV